MRKGKFLATLALIACVTSSLTGCNEFLLEYLGESDTDVAVSDESIPESKSDTSEVVSDTEAETEAEIDLTPTEGLNYFLSEDGQSYSVIGIEDRTIATVVIPTEYQGLPVKEIEPEAFYEYDSLTRMIIPDSVTNIGDGAFAVCRNLTSVTLPEGLIKIGRTAFSGCTSLKSITIPSSVTSIGEFAFNTCSSLESISVHEGNPIYHASGNCLIETASKTLIAGCQNSIIPDDGSVTKIGVNSFIYIPLTSITIPACVTSIDANAFEANDFENISVSAGNTVYHSSGNCLIETASKTLIVGSQNSVIPTDGSVTSIGGGAFADCNALTSITIPDSITSIGNYAFDGCESMTNVIIPDGVTSIGYSAFSHCNALTSITIPAGVTHIEPFVFSGCENLKSIAISKNVTSIDSTSFYMCDSLESISVDKLNSVYHAEGNCLIVTASKTLFLGCQSSVIPTDGSVTSISSSAFSKCSNLKSITIPNSVTSIGETAFWDCSSLTSITIGDGVTSIGDTAFRGCSSLTSITIPDGVTSIGEDAFADCSSLTSITIGDSVTSIGDGAFSGCSSLTSITIGDGVTSIGDMAFRNCSNLTSITIPNSVTNIGSAVFVRCDKLTSIIFTGTKDEWKLVNKKGWDVGMSAPRTYTIHCTDGDITP